MMTTRSTRPPFTATQWQELEHQAIIYKHLVSGVPIPPDLLFPFRRSMDLFPHQPLGWGCYHLGYGRKPDPEPGRCRRTDGKKWRCSKDAYPDSKYCERHMHRGRNRSRKPVELIPSTTPPTPSSSSVTSPITPSSYSISSEEINHSNNQHQHQHNHPFYNNNNNSPPLHPFLYSHSSSSTSPSIGYNNSTHVVPDSLFDKDYRTSRYANELKNERAFFTEASGTLRNVPESSLEDDPWGLTLTPQPKEKRYHSQSGYSQLQLQGFGDFSKAKDQQHHHHHHQDQYQHCFVLGTDFKSNRPMKVEREEPKQELPLRHFFA